MPSYTRRQVLDKRDALYKKEHELRKRPFDTSNGTAEQWKTYVAPLNKIKQELKKWDYILNRMGSKDTIEIPSSALPK
jgi:hypothetical protein